VLLPAAVMTTSRTAASGSELRALLEKLAIPLDAAAVLGVWPTEAGGLEVHLAPATFWRVVERWRVAVTSTERRDWLLPYRHRVVLDGVEFLTFSATPVLPPGTLTPGFALRLT
jgi:hypothetical protein